jgi:6-pyruvoyltetrahydropterin/6-carboxytetrahydropterin synthase
VTVEGPLDENRYVIDFIALKDKMRRITDELDHRVLLPTQSRLIQVTENGTEVTARFAERRWIFPREDCVLLPVENTTAELLARWIGGRLRDALTEKYGAAPPVVRIDVEECFGQSATCELRED